MNATTERTSAAAVACAHCAPVGERPDSRNLFKIGIALALAGQGMVFGLGYNNALRAGEAPAYGTTAYWAIHGALIASAVLVIALLAPALIRDMVRHLSAWRITVEALFVISMLGAFTGSLVSTFTGRTSVYYEIVAVVLVVYSVGRELGARNREKVLAAIDRFRERFDTVHIEKPGGHRVSLPLAQLGQAPWPQVSVYPGEPIAVDGVIREGEGFVRETALTGEPSPVVRKPGDPVLAGTFSVDGAFTIDPTAVRGQRQIDRVIELVEIARERPSRAQRQADRIMRVFVPFVVGVSLATFAGWWFLAPDATWAQALFNAMAVLLVACPCALGLATPIAVWGGLHTLSRMGLVARSGAFLDVLADARLFLFDKTGTLSEGELRLQKIHFNPSGACPPHMSGACPPSGSFSPAWIRSAVASIETRIEHPVAEALRSVSSEIRPVRDLRVVPGRGVEGNVGGHRVFIGQPEAGGGSEAPVTPDTSTAATPLPDAPGVRWVHVVVDGEYCARLELRETLRASTVSSLSALRKLGVQCRILTGDPDTTWREVAGVPVEGSLTPAAKVERVRALRAISPDLVFVGDGFNDAAAMAESPASIAIAQGADLTRAVGDAVLPGEDLSCLPKAVALARRIQSRLRGNLWFAASYNLVGMSLAAAGMLHPVVAALLMVVSSALVSFRALRSTQE